MGSQGWTPERGGFGSVSARLGASNWLHMMQIDKGTNLRSVRASQGAHHKRLANSDKGRDGGQRGPEVGDGEPSQLHGFPTQERLQGLQVAPQGSGVTLTWSNPLGHIQLVT